MNVNVRREQKASANKNVLVWSTNQSADNTAWTGF